MIPKKTTLVGVLLFVVIFLLILFYFDVAKKAEIKAQNENLLSEMQNRLTELQNENSYKSQLIEEYEKKLSENTSKINSLSQQDSNQQVQENHDQACKNVRVLYISIPKQAKGASRLVGYSNIVSLYKAEKKELSGEESYDGEHKGFKKDLNLVEKAYKEYLEAKKTCPEFKEF